MTSRLRVWLESLAGRWRFSLWLVFVIAALTRAGAALWLPAEVAWEDGLRYIQVADNLLAGRGFGGIWDNFQSVPTQPVLLAGLIAVVGKHYTVIRLAFALMGAATCVLGALLARRLFDATTALIAGLVLAVYPPLVYLGALFEYPQPLFLLLMTGVFLLWYSVPGRGLLWRMALVGLLYGLAVETVPTVQDYAPVLLLLCFLRFGRRAWLPALVLLASASVAPAAWTLRNLSAYGEPIMVNKAAGSAFWLGNNDNFYTYGKPGIVPACAPGFEFTVYCRELSEVADVVLHSNMTPLEAVNYFDRAGWEHGKAYFRDSPQHAGELVLRKFGLFWTQLADAVAVNESNAPATRDRLIAVSYFPILALALVAVWLLRQRFMELLPLYAYIGALSAPYCIMLPVTRYRLPIEFLAVILAAWTLNCLLQRADSK